MKIRKATKKDIDFIVRKQRELNHYHRKFDRNYYAPSANAAGEFCAYLKKIINDDNFLILVADTDDIISGYIMGWLELRPPIYRKRRLGYISNFFVDKKVRGSGIGFKLYKRIEKWFRNKGVHFIEIRASTANKNALEKFYRYGLKMISTAFLKEL